VLIEVDQQVGRSSSDPFHQSSKTSFLCSLQDDEESVTDRSTKTTRTTIIMDRLKGILPHRKGHRTCPTPIDEPQEYYHTGTPRHLKIEHGQENTELVLVHVAPANNPTTTSSVLPISMNMKPKTKRKKRLILMRRKLRGGGPKTKATVRSTASMAPSVASCDGLGEDISEITGNSASFDGSSFYSSDESESSGEEDDSCTMSTIPEEQSSKKSSKSKQEQQQQNSNTMYDSAIQGMVHALDMTAMAIGLMPIKEEKTETTMESDDDDDSSASSEDSKIPKHISIPCSPTPSFEDPSSSKKKKKKRKSRGAKKE